MKKLSKEYITNKLISLSKSKFRSSFHLRKYMIEYIDKVGIEKIKEHTVEFIESRLSNEVIENDGRQTPTKGHPTFIAQHACACCCRGCLEKWHGIKRGTKLSKDDKNYIYLLLISWINNEYKNSKGDKI